MNLLLTDQLDCPKCLAGIGLILLADRIEGRRVFEGQLGCPQCRTKYAVMDGVADFLAGAPADPVAEPTVVDVLEVAALFGITEGSATVLLWGAYEDVGAQLVQMIPDMQVVVAHPCASDGEFAAMSALRVAEALPLRASSMRAVMVGPGVAGEDALRVCGLAGRVVWVGASDEARAKVEQRGFRVLAQDADRVVAVRVA